MNPDEPERTDPSATTLFHVALPDDWARAAGTGTYGWSTRGVTLEEEGFVHGAHRHQLDGVVERFYADVEELAILVVDRDLLTAPVVDEPPADGVDELFPHVYGPIPVAAVVRVVQWRAADGVAPSVAVASG